MLKAFPYGNTLYIPVCGLTNSYLNLLIFESELTDLRIVAGSIGDDFAEYITRLKQNFYESRVYDEMNPAIAKIKSSLKQGVTSEDIELLSIEIKEEKFEIKTIPWSVIATQLIKE